MEFPFISTRAHREILAAKDETIAILRETLAGLQQSLKSLEELAEAAKPKPFVPRARGEVKDRAAAPVDYAKLDPQDNKALVMAARQEFGPGRHSVQQIARRAEHIKRQVLIQRAAQSETAKMPAAPPPTAVNDQIEQAMRDGEAAAVTGAN